MFLAAVAVAGTWFAAKQLWHGEAHARARAVELRDVRTQEVQSVAIDTPRSPRHERRLPVTELRDLLTTKAGDLLDETKLAADRRALEAALRMRGFLAAQVAPAEVAFAANGGAYVVFDVERGPMFHLRSIRVTGPGEELADVVTISSGDDAIPARLEHARETLADVLAGRAASSRVELRVHEDPATASVDVELATTEVTGQALPRRR